MDNLQIGSRLKKLRNERGMSIKQLSEKSQVSTGMISQIEHDKVSPTIVSVHRLAEALNSNIGYFFEDDMPKYHLIKNGSHKTIIMNNNHAYYKLLSPDENSRQIDFTEVTLKQNEISDNECISHDGEEAGYVISGILSLELGEEIITLNKGDSIYFKSSIPHRYMNLDDEECVSIWAMTPKFF